MMKRSGQPAAIDGRSECATRRVVLLGASNLTKGLGTVVETAAHVWGRPLEVIAACGHGRSYGQASSVFGRKLPGILQCGLWDHVDRNPRLPTAALVTDIGNDLLYQQPVDRIAEWVEACFDRLAAAGAQIAVTQLPVENLSTLSRARFQLLRTVFFPGSRISLEEVAQGAHALNDHLRRLAECRNISIVAQRNSWYGFDPIHIKRRQRTTAWQEIFSAWPAVAEAGRPGRSSIVRGLYLRLRAPERRRLLGFEQRRVQPAARLKDGTTVAIF